jgi:hypothetical protein
MSPIRASVQRVGGTGNVFVPCRFFLGVLNEGGNETVTIYDSDALDAGNEIVVLPAAVGVYMLLEHAYETGSHGGVFVSSNTNTNTEVVLYSD